MINLDPSLLDQDKQRKERRKHLFRSCAIPIALLLAAAIFFLSTWVYNLGFIISYNNKHYPMAHDLTESRFLINVLEPYIASYNQGAAQMMMGDFKKAEERFTESLKNNPPEDKLCKVYENLSLSIEKQADESLGAELYRDAIDLYSRAESVLYANGCADKDNAKGKSAKSGIAKDRIDEKRNDAVNALNKSTDDGDSTPEEARKKDVTDGDLENSKKNKVAPNSRALGVQYIESLINGTGHECSVQDGDMCW